MVVKVYETPQSSQEKAKKTHHYRSVIGTGKVVDIENQGKREIYFIGKEEEPKGVFIYSNSEEEKDSLNMPQLKWAENIPEKNSDVYEDEKTPIVFVDGKKVEYETISSIDVDTIESINVLKEKSATEKYGEEGRYGVIEITLKKKK